jgi:hypothetical protein
MKKDEKVAELAGDCGELWNCGSQKRSAIAIPQLFFSPQFCNRFGCPQYCGVADVRT